MFSVDNGIVELESCIASYSVSDFHVVKLEYLYSKYNSMCQCTESRQDADMLATTQSLKYEYHNKQFKIAWTGSKLLKPLY